MMENNINEKIQEWLKLNSQGLFVEAKNFYYNNLFEEIIDRFVNTTNFPTKCDVLFSMLGFSPEPIILTQRALAPSVHVIFTTNKDYSSNNEIISYLEKYLTSDYKIVNLKDDDFHTIYENLRFQMNIYPSTNYVLDVTGGKKSMVASAAIFARDYNCNVVYVDYDEYISELRRPKPGTERLNVVYSALGDLINIIDVTSCKKNESKDNKSAKENQNGKSTEYVKSLNKLPKSDNLRDSFNKAFNHYVNREDLYSKWLPKGISLFPVSERTFELSHNKSGSTIKIQRSQLYSFFIDCKRSKQNADLFISDCSQRASTLNHAIKALLDIISMELFGQKLKK